MTWLATSRCRRRFLACALALQACAPIAASDPTYTLDLQLQTARGLQAVARGWHGADVYEFDVATRVQDPATGLYVVPAPSLDRVLLQKPTPSTHLLLPGLSATRRYQLTVTARGNAGGTAPDQVLNASAPAVVVLDPPASGGQLPAQIAVPLDPVPFGLSLQLPSNATTPGSVPAWATRVDVALADAAASATPLVTATYTPDRTMTLNNVRGDHHYTVSLTVHSATGHTTTTIPDYFVARADDVETTLAPTFPAFVPPTGTLLATYTLAGGTFGLAIDAQDHLWVTNQHGGTVSEIDASGAAVVSPIAVSSQPRGIAVDRATGDVWAINFAFFGTAYKIVGGQVTGSFGTGLLSAGAAVDTQHRVWIANAGDNTLTCLDANGTPIAGSPFAVGSGPAALAIDPVSGDVWVSNAQGASISKVTAAGVVQGPFAAGSNPGGIGIAPDGTVWVACNGDGTIRRYHPDGSVAAPNLALGNGPSALAIDPQTGAVWVGLLNGNQMAKLASDGHVLGTYPSGTFPSNVAIDSQHHVWVVGGGNVTELAP